MSANNSKLNEILLVDRERAKSQVPSGFDNSDLKVMIIKDYFNHKQRGRTRIKTNYKEYRLYHKLRIVRLICLFVYMFLACFQKPGWCYEGDYKDSCTGLAGGPDYIITSNLPYLSHLTFSILEGLLMAFLIFNKGLELKFTNNRLFHIRFFLLLSLFFMTIVSDIVWSFYQTKYQINLLIRPIFFALYHRVVRNAVKNYSVILFKARSMILVLFLNIIFFSILGRIAFCSDDYEIGLFHDPSNALFNILVLQTTANFPDIMLPIYKSNRYASLFFVLFLLINNVILLNLTLSVFYLNYKKNFEESLSKETTQEHEASFIQDALNLEILTRKQLNELYKKKMGISTTEIIKEIPDLRTYEYRSPAIYRLFSFLKINLVTSIFSGICFFSLFFNGEDGFLENESMWVSTIFVLNIPILFETLVFFFELGLKSFIRSFFNIFEFLTSSALFVLCIICLSGGVGIKIVEIFTLFRFFRFFIMLLNFHYLRSVFESFLGCLPLFLDLFSVLIVLYFIFASFGMYFFGGILNEHVVLNYKNNQYSNVYYSSNFNDLPNSFLILFSLMIVNNWNNQVDVHVLISGSENYRLFFALFYFLSVMLCLNLMIASLIEILSCLWKNAEDNIKEKQTDNVENNNNLQFTMHNLSDKDTKFNSFLELEHKSFDVKNEKMGKNLFKSDFMKSKKKIKKKELLRLKKLHRQKTK